MVACKYIDICVDHHLIVESSIRDTRLFVEVSEGSAITFGIASRDVLSQWWAPMKLPRSLEKVVSEMDGPNCGMNVSFFDGKHDAPVPAVSPPPD
jgi:hypothetical protein